MLEFTTIPARIWIDAASRVGVLDDGMTGEEAREAFESHTERHGGLEALGAAISAYMIAEDCDGYVLGRVGK